jgi:hypothetical protein
MVTITENKYIATIFGNLLSGWSGWERGQEICPHLLFVLVWPIRVGFTLRVQAFVTPSDEKCGVKNDVILSPA